MLSGALLPFHRTRTARLRRIISLTRDSQSVWKDIAIKEIPEAASQLGLKLRQLGFRPELVARSFALVREVAGRTINMRHFNNQLMGGLAMLDGMVAEMETGEGKTLTATLTASTAALAGIPVHIITVNDYLTARDASEMGSIYKTLGLSVGCITHQTSPEERRRAYLCDITYCTNKEIVFDYLRDRITLRERSHPLLLQGEQLHSEKSRSERLLLRGLHFGIIDEADSILVDEARTPLLISQTLDSKAEEHFFREVMDISRNLTETDDYTVKISKRTIELTDRGKENLVKMTADLGGLWSSSVHREDIISKALSAEKLFHRDEHYLVRENKVEIIDEFTGRVMEGRSWERGLHQLIEIKEDCDITPQHETQARISYQRFFRRYLRLAGMTGTAREIRRELWSVYHLPTMKIPTNRLMIRSRLPDLVLPDNENKWHAVVRRVAEFNKMGRPVLLGTRTVAASEHASRLLKEAGLNHHVLNAKQDDEEAAIVAGAGNSGEITIATNMAGRGTDIKLGPGVAEKGGLHVLLTERHEAARIDRQLSGRCGRQGDPGSHEAILSLEDPLLGDKLGLLLRLARFFHHGFLGKALAGLTIRLAQKKIERYHARVRRQLFQEDSNRKNSLSFTKHWE
jgi:preprotein translocase subunit SecA